MKYTPYNPIEIPRKNGRIISDKKELNAFWSEVNEEYNGLSNAVGCYIFSIRAGKGILPWYVGLAEKQSFQNECFTVHKLHKYNECINLKKGTPMLTLVPKRTATGLFSRKGGHRDIHFLEKLLIASCLDRNSNLMNTQSTKLLKQMVVPGLLNTPKGRVEAPVKEFKRLIGV